MLLPLIYKIFRKLGGREMILKSSKLYFNLQTFPKILFSSKFKFIKINMHILKYLFNYSVLSPKTCIN